jgi:8-oxo-dGTP diphosphatase
MYRHGERGGGMRQIVGGFPVRGGKLLLGFRAPHKPVRPRTWDAIGGRVEPGETPAEALVREFGEEVAIVPTIYRLLTEFSFSGDGDAWRYFMYRIDAWTGGEPRIANDEHTDLRWFTPAEAAALPDLAAPDYIPLFAALEG